MKDGSEEENEARYIGKIRKSLQSVEQSDKKIAREKLTERRLKKKKHLKR